VKPLSEVLLEIHDRLDLAAIPHAFGGAIALAYYLEEPRATRAIDCNVFIPSSQSSHALTQMKDLGTISQEMRDRARIKGQVRFLVERTPVDLFFNDTDFHTSLAMRIRWVPFADKEIQILSGVDLVVFKVMFDRPKDWADIYQIALDRTVDLSEARATIVGLMGSDDRRVMEMDAMVARADKDRDQSDED
jgi:hypothetical protein